MGLWVSGFLEGSCFQCFLVFFGRGLSSGFRRLGVWGLVRGLGLWGFRDSGLGTFGLGVLGFGFVCVCVCFLFSHVMARLAVL